MWVAPVAVLALGGCVAAAERVTMDPSRLVLRSDVALACTFRVASVEDARPEGDKAGWLGKHQFTFDDAPGVVRRGLAESGFGIDGDAPGELVHLRILRLYLAQNQVTKIPVAVYEARLGDAPPFLVRSQQADMNWNGSQDEAYEGYTRAVRGANTALVERLNAECPPGS